MCRQAQYWGGGEYFSRRVQNLVLGVKKIVAILLYILGDILIIMTYSAIFTNKLAMPFHNRQEFFPQHFQML